MIQWHMNSITFAAPGCSQGGFCSTQETKNGSADLETSCIGNSGNLMKSTNNKLLPLHRSVLSEVVKRNKPFPHNGVLFGVAEDGMPMAFDAHSSKSPNIIVWNKLVGQGLKILKVIAEFIFRYRTKTQMEFIVLTSSAEEWGELNKYGMGVNGETSCIGIIPLQSELSNKVLYGLARWVSEPHEEANHPIIVLIDGMENLSRVSQDFRDHFRCILQIGRRKNVFVVGTSDKKHFRQVQEWLDGFQQEIYGSDAVDLFETMVRKEIIYFVAPNTELI
jgi:hypothetical protein